MSDEDDEFEYWMNASEEEVEREEARISSAFDELDRKLSRLPIPMQVAHHRHFLLRDIITNRRRLRNPSLCEIECIEEMWRKSIRRGQMRLLQLRAWRSTGIYPGSA